MKLFLGIETSCDETAVGIFDADSQTMLANNYFSQVDLHAAFGGVMPEVASRSHVEKILPVFELALSSANVSLEQIDVMGVTTNPGLHGSLLVGICFAKALAAARNIPLLAIDHNHGHIVSGLLGEGRVLREDITYPFLCLSVSGGHNSFYLVESPNRYLLLGNTTDDAAGEAFDKVAKLLGLAYPGGPIVERYAAMAQNQDFFKYPRSKDKKTLNFSFSGLKTAVLYNLVKQNVYNQRLELILENLTDEIRARVCSSFQVCIGDIFEQKIELAFSLYPEVKTLVLVGGVSCNKYFVSRLNACAKKFNRSFFSPPREFCTDNGAMIALATYFEYGAGRRGDDLNLIDVVRY